MGIHIVYTVCVIRSWVFDEIKKYEIRTNIAYTVLLCIIASGEEDINIAILIARVVNPNLNLSKTINNNILINIFPYR